MKGISCGCCDIWQFILGFKQFSAFASLSHFYWPRSVACRRSSSLCPSDSRRTSSPSALFGVSRFTTLCHRGGGIRNARDHFHIAGPLAAISFCLPRLPLKHFLLFWGRSNSYLLLFCSVPCTGLRIWYCSSPWVLLFIAFMERLAHGSSYL